MKRRYKGFGSMGLKHERGRDSHARAPHVHQLDSRLRTGYSPVVPIEPVLRSPLAVQRYLRAFPYNREPKGATLRSAKATLEAGVAHCFEAALVAASILEPHGYVPQLLSLDSVDDLDHVLFVFRASTGWGSIGRSRDDGLHGRAPKFRSVRDLAWSYFDPYVDKTGRLRGYKLFQLDDSGIDWRAGRKNLWALDEYRMSLKHTPMVSSQKRYETLHARYTAKGALPRQAGWW